MKRLKNIEEFLQHKINEREDIIECSYVIHEMNSDERIMRNSGNNIYPASLSKICIAGEVLRRIESGSLSFFKEVEISPVNQNAEDALKSEVDNSYTIFHPGESYCIKKLLQEMLANSNNVAANTLIDLVTREGINENMHSLGYRKTTIARKFLAREKEQQKYQDASINTGTAYNFFQMWHQIYDHEFISEFVSREILEMTAQVHVNNRGFPFFEYGGTIHRKGGWLKSELHNGATALWEHDSGIWKIENEIIIYSIMTLVKNKTGDLFGFSDMVL